MVTFLENRFSVFWIGLIVSLLFHTVSLTRRLDRPFVLTEENSPKQFEIVEFPALQKKTPPKQIVQTEDAGNKDIDPDAKFLSDRNQKAELEKRAKNIGEFRESEGQGTESVFSKPVDNGFPPDVMEGENLSEKKPTLEQKLVESLSLKDLSIGKNGLPASNDSVAKNVGDGDRTVLSTREFRYFGYYQRIRELLRQHWGPNVQQKLMKLWQMGKATSADEWTTELHILLDESGRVKKIAKVTSCGLMEIDTAAVEAFERAGPFPHPPRGLLEDDGFVRINWSFVLTTESSPRVQFAAPSGVIR